jgi:hypothetical protein
MNDAKKIYVEENAAVPVRAVPALPAAMKSKTVFERIAEFLCGPDLDLATFERIEGISSIHDRPTVRPRNIDGWF